MNYRWTIKEKPDDVTVNSLSSSLKIPKSLARVLVVRGISTQEEAEKFFDPSLDDLYDPFLMDGMDVASDRIIRAVENNELIWIHGDYDVDGTASTSMVLQFLREIGGKVSYYIPDRFQEGYGLSKRSIDKAISSGAAVIITVDVGITSYEPLLYAKNQGVDCIVCDHHEPGNSTPDVLTIIDPMKANCPYPFKHLAACGVAFKMIQAISQKLKIPQKAFEYLDFVAIASAADMVPLVDENRILVNYGLKLLNSNPRPGIKGLIYCTHLRSNIITASSIVYAMAPLINAAGRLGDACRAVEMMIQTDEIAAFRIAQELEQENRRRRVFDEKTFEEACILADKWLLNPNRRSLVLYAPNWHAGVIGIVASRLVDRYHLPTVLLTSFDNNAKGSARSISGFDIHKALKECNRFLLEYGGHKHAAGLSLPEKNIPEFAEVFDKIAQDNISSEMVMPEIKIDTALQLNELSPQFLKILNKFAPYGFDNNKPIFLSTGVTSSNGVKIVANSHLKFRAYQSNFVIDAMAYQLLKKIDLVSSHKQFSIVYNIDTVSFNSNPNPQLRIKDLCELKEMNVITVE